MTETEFSGPNEEGDYLCSTIVDLFEERVLARPQDPALLFNGGQMNYVDLNTKSNQVAHALTKAGAGKGSLVPVCMERGPEMIIAILAILKAGAAYVPIEPDYPIERIDFMLQDCKADIAICSELSRKRLSRTQHLELVMQDRGGGIVNEPASNLSHRPAANDLAYIIYTSGSTGVPKGVMIEHRNVSAFLHWATQEFLPDHFNLVYASSSICFDLSVFELFFPLCSGKPLRIIESGLYIANHLKCDARVLLNTVPGVVESLLKQGADLTAIAMINMAGEPIPPRILQKLDTTNTEVRNLYGPTETTVYSTVYHLVKEQPALIGKPIANTYIYILNAEGKKSDVGRTGEIYIGGASVARGYLNNDVLTRERFLPDPFQNNPGSVMYKTGDLGRWLVDGNIEFLGRLDDQVKIHGYRIELSEIEHVLEQSAMVQRAIVMAKKNREGMSRLVAYIVPETEFKKEAIASWLREKLPDFMVPALLVEIDHVPTTFNGKTDRKALPDPDENDFVRHEYFAPASAIEKQVAGIWKEVLKIDRIGINDNFFELGGTSLMTLEVVSRAEHLGFVLQPMDLYLQPTVQQLSHLIEARMSEEKDLHQGPQQKKGASIVCIQKEGDAPAFFAIPGFWLYHKLSFHLGHIRPFYGFEPYPYKDVHAVALDFISEVRSVQPRGPYFLGAFCEHYPVVFEMAHALLAAGEEVPVLALFDAYSPQATLPKGSIRYIERKIKFYSNQMKGLSIPNKLKFILAELRRTMRFKKSRFEPVRTSTAHPRIYPGNVALFKASITSPLFTNDPLMGWKDYVRGKIETYTIDGDHSGILQEPSVIQLADALSKVLMKYSPADTLNRENKMCNPQMVE